MIGLLCTLGIVGAAALLWWGKTPRLRAAFCLAGAALGIAFALATPPLGGPDEYVHFAGSYAAASRLMGQPDYDDEGGLWVRDCDEPYVTAETGPVDAPVYKRDDFVPGQTIPGPCICEQMDTTLVVPEGWTIHVDGYHNLKIKDEVN